jgi:hypothetical protein
VTIDAYGPPPASEVEAHKGRGQPIIGRIAVHSLLILTASLKY